MCFFYQKSRNWCFCVLLRFQGQKEFKAARVTKKHKGLTAQNKRLNLTRKHEKPVHTLFDEDGEMIQVTPSKALSKAKLFLETVVPAESSSVDEVSF